MTPTPEQLKAYRDIGAKSLDLHWGGSQMEVTRIEFFEPIPQLESGAIIPRELTQNAPFKEEQCACGHPDYAHNASGECTLGCKLESCARGKS